MNKFMTTIKCAYQHCQVDVPVLEACELRITTGKGIELYKGHRGCLEALEEEIQKNLEMK